MTVAQYAQSKIGSAQLLRALTESVTPLVIRCSQLPVQSEEQGAYIYVYTAKGGQ